VVRFEWDAKKERQNLRKHGVSFEEAKQLLTSDVDFLEIYGVQIPLCCTVPYSCVAVEPTSGRAL
jgi:hypothetical protein